MPGMTQSSTCNNAFYHPVMHSQPGTASAPFYQPGPSVLHNVPSSSNSNSLPSGPKQRRVSLPASQHRVPPYEGFRDEMGLVGVSRDTGKGNSLPYVAPVMERSEAVRGTNCSGGDVSSKRPRKRWTKDETEMLRQGCNEHGVGNWKTILNDPKYSFQSRSPGDLKDRFRTYFPDEYRKLYPNAKTHVSRARTAPQEPRHYFEKARPSRKKPFSPEEDEALRKGYEIHGAHWATIVKDPVFQDRRGTELRDHFRNIFPELYHTAGYKPRPAKRGKKARSEPPSPPMGPGGIRVRGRRKSMVSAKSAATVVAARGGMSEGEGEGDVVDDDGSDVDDTEVDMDQDVEAMDLDLDLQGQYGDGRPTSSSQRRPQPRPYRTKSLGSYELAGVPSSPRVIHDRPPSAPFPSTDTFDFIPPSLPPRPDSLYSESSNADESSLSQWSASGELSTWATTASSPADLLFASASHAHFDSHGFPFPGSTSRKRQPSAWGPTNWLNPDARLGGGEPPMRYHNVVDRYDLYSAPSNSPHDFASEAGAMAASWSAEQERERRDESMAALALFRGFTHHSTAGDLIRGSGVRATGVAGMQLPAGWQPLLPDFGGIQGAFSKFKVGDDSGFGSSLGGSEADEEIRGENEDDEPFEIGLKELENAGNEMAAAELSNTTGGNVTAAEVAAAAAALELLMPMPVMHNRAEDATTPTFGASSVSARVPSPLSLSQSMSSSSSMPVHTSHNSTPSTLLQNLALEVADFPVTSNSIPSNSRGFRTPTRQGPVPPPLQRSQSLFDHLTSLRGQSFSPSLSIPSLDLATTAWDFRHHPSSIGSLSPLFGESFPFTIDTAALDLADAPTNTRRTFTPRDVPNTLPAPMLPPADVGGVKKRKRVSWTGGHGDNYAMLWERRSSSPPT